MFLYTSFTDGKILVLRVFLHLRVIDRASVDERISGPRNGAENCNEYNEFWNVLFDEEIRNKIVDYTNIQIENICSIMIAEDKTMETYHHVTDLKEINAFIALLYYSGMWKSHDVNVKELWSNINGCTLYRCVMPKSRFLFLCNCLRFDKREERSPDNRLAPIRELWDRFIQNCEYYYKPSNYLTVDEQLLSYRGRCKFRMYIKSKPDKYGMKIITLNDAQTFYLVSFSFLFFASTYVLIFNRTLHTIYR